MTSQSAASVATATASATVAAALRTGKRRLQQYETLSTGQPSQEANVIDTPTQQKQQLQPQQQHQRKRRQQNARYVDLAQDNSESSSSFEEIDENETIGVFSASPLQVESPETSSEESDNDPLTRIVRERSGGFVLATALILSGCLVFNSALLLWHQPNDIVASEQTTEIPLYVGHCSATTNANTSMLLSSTAWRSSLELEMMVLTNLIHAALLAATAVLVYVRGDVVWLYFLRHTVFFWTIVAILYSLASIASVVGADKSNGDSGATESGFHLVAKVTFAACSTLLLVLYGRTSQRVRTFQKQEGDFNAQSKTALRDEPYESSSRWARHALSYGCWAIQCAALAYFLVTTLSWWNLQNQQENTMLMNNGDDNCYKEQRWLSSSSSWLLNGRHLHEVMTMAQDPHSSSAMMMNGTQMNNMTSSKGSMDGASGSVSSSNGHSSLLPFVMAYSETAHTSFVLALMQLAATYPDEWASVMACLLAVSWRLLIATASLLHILFWRTLTASGSKTTSASLAWIGQSPRDVYSLIFTVIEVATMIPIVAAAVWLFLVLRRRSHGNGQWPADEGVVEASDKRTEHDSSRDKAELASSTNAADQVERGGAVIQKDGLMIVPEPAAHQEPLSVSTYPCLTVAQIATASTDFFSTQQIWGATLLSFGCSLLLIEMTSESILLLSQTMVGSDATHDVYKWGMHAVVMYVFCTTMGIESSVYRYARWLLVMACPTGSVVALWQLSSLSQQTAIGSDAWTVVFAVLLVLRAVAGLFQTAGVLLLNSTEPRSLSAPGRSDMPSSDFQHVLTAAQAQASRALFGIFLPTLVAYVATSNLSGNCLAPMISPMLPPPATTTSMVASNADASSASAASSSSCDMRMTDMAGMDLMLMQNIPGLGLFFHFGLVAILFAAQGIQKSIPSYKPSLPLATLITGHVGLLSLTSLIWDVVQTQGWTDLSTDDVVRRVVLLAWSLSALYLSHCLNRLWALRIEAVR